jgi:hypothetical protein
MVADTCASRLSTQFGFFLSLSLFSFFFLFLPLFSFSPVPGSQQWKEVLDKASNKPYWYNRVTKETTWTNPLPAAEDAQPAAKAEETATAAAASTPAPAEAAPVAAAAAAPAAEKPLWREVVDKASGKPYWYNRLTKETTWSVRARREGVGRFFLAANGFDHRFFLSMSQY